MFGSEIVVAVGDPGDAELSLALASDLSAALDLPVRTLHVEAEPEEVATAIAAGLSADSILVIHSEHANRWSGKWSVAEHVIDGWGGIVVAVGPNYSNSVGAGPVMAAVDGSPSAQRVAEPAQVLADALERSVQFCQVVSAAEGGNGGPASSATDTEVIVGNDPVSALLAQATAHECAMIALAARGDRSSTRSSISRTCSGIIAGATQPVMIVGTRWQNSAG